jgi:hypothetical protein
MNKRNLKISSILIGCLVGLSALFAVNYALGTSTTATTKATALVIDTAATVSFDNDTKIKEYTLEVPENTVVNISLKNSNGSALHWWVSRDDLATSAGSSVFDDCCGCIKDEDVYYDGGADTYGPQNDSSLLFIAVEKITLTICVQVVDWYNEWDDVSDGIFTSASGTLLAKKVLDLSAAANKIETTVKSLALNFTALALGGTNWVIKTLNVAEDGYYLFSGNATVSALSGEFSGDSLYVGIKELGTADPDTMCSWSTVSGPLSPAADLSFTTVDHPDDDYLAYEAVYLEAGKDYLVYAASQAAGNRGNLDLAWSVLKTVSGAVGETATTVDFSSADVTAVSEMGGMGFQKSAWVLYEDTPMEFDTLYDASATQTAGDPWWGVSFGPYSSWQVSKAAEGQILLIEDCVRPTYKIGKVAYAPNHKYIRSNVQGLPGILGGLNATYKLWSQGAWGKLTEKLLMKVSASNFTGGQWAPAAKVDVIIKENADGVADFPDSGTPINKKLDGATNDTTGLYKLEKKNGKELQIKASGFSSYVNPTWTVAFISCWDIAVPCLGMSLPGVAVGSFMTTSFTVDNDTWNWDGMGLSWDSAIVQEVAIFNPLVYVLITASNPTFPNLQNATSLILTYTEEAFLKNKKEFIASRDNQMQVYELALGPCASAQLESVLGQCCSLSATLKFVPKKWNAVSAVTALNTLILMGFLTATEIKSPLPLCIKSQTVYLILSSFNGDSANGSILKLTITNISVSIPGYSVFFTTVAALGVVAALIWKRRQH